VEYNSTVAFTAGQPYLATFWGKGDGTFTGIPAFLLWNAGFPPVYCQSLANNSFTTTWTIYSFLCTPHSSGSSYLAATALTPIGQTGTFWIGAFTFSPVIPLTPGSLLTSNAPYGIGPASNAQQTTTLGTTALLLGATNTTVAGLALTTSSINGVTPTTGGSANTYLNGAGNYTAPSVFSSVNQSVAGSTGGTCTMAAATTCTLTIGHTYTTPVCTAVEQGTSATVIAAACGVSGTTVTVTAATSNSATWGALVFGNPN
jgi:hypothetical protein